jgi:hypothetical protein
MGFFLFWLKIQVVENHLLVQTGREKASESLAERFRTGFHTSYRWGRA